MKAIIKKVKAVEGGLPAGAWQDYSAGWDLEGQSVPIDYEVEGEIEGIQIGKSLTMQRGRRNNDRKAGTFTTSEVTKIGDGWFTTKNSFYLIRYL